MADQRVGGKRGQGTLFAGSFPADSCSQVPKVNSSHTFFTPTGTKVLVTASHMVLLATPQSPLDSLTCLIMVNSFFMEPSLL